VARPNRFVVDAELDDGRAVRCHLPNTARLGDLLVPGAALVLASSDDPARRTGWTVTRVRVAGHWVALAAGHASTLVADHLGAGHALPGWPATTAVRREVVRGRHRFDLEVTRADARTAIVEVKSLSRAVDGVAPLSGTPSARGVGHLDALAALVGAGEPAAAVFVVQRGDVEVVDLTAAADPAWVAAVRRARAAGVTVVAYGCAVGRTSLRLDRPVPVRDATG
jgi:sugar fermentation stimulation protein A